MYNSKIELLKYAISLYELSPLSQAKILAKSISKNLMKKPIISLVFKLWSNKTIIQKFEDYYISHLLSNKTRLNDEFDNLIRHMLFGNDKTIKESAGGFNNDEFNALVNLVDDSK